MRARTAKALEQKVGDGIEVQSLGESIAENPRSLLECCGTACSNCPTDATTCWDSGRCRSVARRRKFYFRGGSVAGRGLLRENRAAIGLARNRPSSRRARGGIKRSAKSSLPGSTTTSYA